MKMKAYKVNISEEAWDFHYPLQTEIVFAENRTEAIKKAQDIDWGDNYRYTDFRAKRAPEFDGLENSTGLKIETQKWKDGFYWTDKWGDIIDSMPEPDEATDEEFQKWYRENVL